MSILPRDQVVVAADGTVSVESVATVDATVSDGFSLSVSTRDAPDVDRTFVESDGTLTVVEGAGVAVRTLDIAGAELLTNPKFASDIAGWTDGSSAGGAIGWDTGRLRTTNTSGTARGRQSVAATIGQRYAYFGERVGGDSVQATIAVGNTNGGNQYKNQTTQPNVSAQATMGILTATTSILSLQFAAGLAGVSYWDNPSLRLLTPTQFPAGTIFEDDFTAKPDGTLGVTPDGLPWWHIFGTGAGQSIPHIVGGEVVVPASAHSTITAAYSCLNLGDGKVAGLHCDVQWGGEATLAVVITQAQGALPTVEDITGVTGRAIHMLFTSTQVAIQTYIASVLTNEAVSYAVPVVTDGRTYEGVGVRLVGSTLTITLPGGEVIERTDAKFATAQGNCAILEHYYPNGSTIGPLTITKAAVELG